MKSTTTTTTTTTTTKIQYANVKFSWYLMMMGIEDEKLAFEMIKKILQAQFGDIKVEDVKSENSLLNSFLRTTHSDILEINKKNKSSFNNYKPKKKQQKLKETENKFNPLEFLQNKLSISEELSIQILNHRKELKVLLTERALKHLCKEMFIASDVTKHKITYVIDFYLINKWSSFKFYYYTSYVERNNKAIKDIKKTVQKSKDEIERDAYERKRDYLEGRNGKLHMAWEKIEEENKHLSDIEINDLKVLKEREITKEYDDMIASKNAKIIIIDQQKQNFLGH